MGGVFAVDAEQRAVEAQGALEFAPWAVTFLEVGSVWSCTEGAGSWLFPAEVVVSISKAVCALDASIEAEVLENLETAFKEEQSIQGCCGVGASYDEEYHVGALLPFPLLRFTEPAGVAVEGNPGAK